jgi:hypothetical protein
MTGIGENIVGIRQQPVCRRIPYPPVDTDLLKPGPKDEGVTARSRQESSFLFSSSITREAAVSQCLVDPVESFGAAGAVHFVTVGNQCKKLAHGMAPVVPLIVVPQQSRKSHYILEGMVHLNRLLYYSNRVKAVKAPQ